MRDVCHKTFIAFGDRLRCSCAVAAIATTLFAAGCGPTPSRVVRIEVKGTVAGDTLTVSGTATVPDGALIAWEAGDAMTNRPDGQMAFTDGTSLVTGGAFKFDVDVQGWPAKIKVWVAFQTILGTSTKQPPEIVDLYGEQGELIEGDTVTSGTLKRVEKEIIVNR